MRQQELFAESGDDNNKTETTNFFLPEALSVESILFGLSVDAFYTILFARMSELPIKKEISRFTEKVIKSGDRYAAARAASDRGDADVNTVLNAAYKVQREIHRLTGLLRFTPNKDGMYAARCSPDYFVLPALADHFFLRFGETPWVIIDEKREICLCREKGDTPKLIPLTVFTASAGESAPNDTWEDLWRLYFRSVNNEAKKNIRLQRQFMPERYQKYLPEKS